VKKKHIITIAGELGSGKSTTAKAISEILGYQHISTGDFMRSMADERGISLSELGEIAEKDPSIDTILDDYNRKIGEMENIVLDSRLGFYFIPDSFKVFLELDSSIAAERILKDKQINPNRFKESVDKFDTKESILKSISTRLLSERKRYKELYGINNHTAHENFDIILNTEIIQLPDSAYKIVEEYKKWLED
jgi:cytidylate kinase